MNLDALCAFAIERGASSIHLDPHGPQYGARLRVDGALVALDGAVPYDVVDALGPAAELDALPGVVDRAGARWRVSVVEVEGGRHVCLHRVLGGTPSFAELGMTAEQSAKLSALLQARRGLILFCGPPRSGRTSTFYAALAALDPSSRRLVTLEDPVERVMTGVLQRPRPPRFVDSHVVARSLAAQDPDVVGIAEIAEPVMADLAFACAGSGMSVLATFRAPTSVNALTLLFQLGMEPFQIVDCIDAVVTQHLLPLVCAACRGAPEGCPECHGTGVRGRTGIFEILEMTPAVRQQMLEGASSSELAAEARKAGMVQLPDRARALVEEGRVRGRDAAWAIDV
jgi:type II secretory ATPase GspE/PulE/Tfp pilus assembly ATPase PilB-like protein